MSRGNLALRLPDGAPFASDERHALDRILGGASAEQRAWLSGFLAGVAGGLLAGNLQLLDARSFPPAESVMIFALTIVGSTST